jgi:hypothetical protein
MYTKKTPHSENSFHFLENNEINSLIVRALKVLTTQPMSGGCPDILTAHYGKFEDAIQELYGRSKFRILVRIYPVSSLNVALLGAFILPLR